MLLVKLWLSRSDEIWNSTVNLQKLIRRRPFEIIRYLLLYHLKGSISIIWLLIESEFGSSNRLRTAELCKLHKLELFPWFIKSNCSACVLMFPLRSEVVHTWLGAGSKCKFIAKDTFSIISKSLCGVLRQRGMNALANSKRRQHHSGKMEVYRPIIQYFTVVLNGLAGKEG
jgi:hypothetical protein